MSTRAPVAPASSAPAAPARACPSAASALLLGDDLDTLAREIARLPELVVQLRHHDARLVVARPLSDPEVDLRLPALAEGPVVGYSGRCDCCGSPGRIVIHDTGRREVLQFCAPADCATSAWNDLLLDLLPRPATSAASFAAEPVSWADSSFQGCAPGLAQTLCTLLNRIWHDDLALHATLHAGAASLAAPFAPESGSVSHGLLTLRAADATLQLLLSAVSRLAVIPSGLDPALEIHTRHEGEKLVLRCAAPAWRRALASLAETAA